ncbi:EF-Hand 1, calcium-binding site [Sesbania bispinosa]|nr:EF-Hand 1, calcium-binding site [Sesbania bispinosa]
MAFLVCKSATRGEAIRVNIKEQQIRKIFEEADRDGDGILRKEDLQFAFHQLGAHLPAWRALRGLHHADINKDGVISKEEVANLINYALLKYGYKV